MYTKHSPQLKIKTTQRLNNFYKQTLNFYGNISKVYDLIYNDHISESFNMMEKISKILKEKNFFPKNILDIGCGTGWDIINIQRHFPDCSFFGFDFSKEMVKKTKENLSKINIKAAIWEGNIINKNFCFTQEFNNFFDLILFRGNALSNLKYNDYYKAFINVFNSLKSEGIFIFDFRDGEELFKLKLPIEIRGYGYKSDFKLNYLSFYYQKHPKTIFHPYNITTVLLTWGIKYSSFNLQYYKIKSHYVLKDHVENTLKTSKYSYYENITKIVGQSLPHLLTYMCYKA